MSETLKNYLFDLGHEIKLRALQAVRERNCAAPEDRSFEAGRVMAFYEVISLMQQNAESFDIPLLDLRLNDIVPDRDLT